MGIRGSAGAGLLALLAVAIVLQVSGGRTDASELEKWLIMPGDVIAGHADIEADCEACHAPLTDQPQGPLCVACHTEIGSDLEGQEGFHGRLPSLQQLDCAGCHAEHEGREVTSVDLDEIGFDHAETDFALRGAHLDLACVDCHEQSAHFRDTASSCAGCHRQDDVHRGQLGQDCAGCHGVESWARATFDHATTPFPLTGAHAAVDCAGCHEGHDFSRVGKTCVACHSADDVHEGRNGDQCNDCHTVSDWRSSTFDHLALTGFPLKGGHDGLGCQDCHRSPEFTDLSGSTCSSCHVDDDAHDGHFGFACGACHDSRDWRWSDFDHGEWTGFALPAGHADLDCASCHFGPTDRELPADCGGCHAADDVHAGQLGNECGSCHVPTHWTAQLFFDHDITSFPLLGAHADAGCESCHASGAFLDAGESCVDCHTDDDAHGGRLGLQCDSCHNPAGWIAWQFEHELVTGFALTGSHQEIACTTCHTQPMSKARPLGTSCSACHSRDDPHRGRFGNKCDACHTTSSFRQVEGL